MFEYTLTTWLLLFFIYSFLGWVWESSYVSIKEKKWINRGFLTGPFLPIYGFGAIIILFTTLPVIDSKVGIYFVGAISATLLELVSGYFIELIFNVRYWDYSYRKIQYKGYICLVSTIAWGFFSILLVDYLNVPIENFLAQFSTKTLTYTTILILIPFTVDMTKSIQNAFDLKKLLKTLEENNKNVDKIITYVDGMQDKLGKDADELKAYVADIKKDAKNELECSKIAIDIHEKINSTMEKLNNDINNEESQDTLTESEKENKKTALQELKTLNNKLIGNEFSIKEIDFKDFKGAISLIGRNPTANHKTMKKEMDKLDALDLDKKHNYDSKEVKKDNKTTETQEVKEIQDTKTIKNTYETQAPKETNEAKEIEEAQEQKETQVTDKNDKTVS